MPLSAKHTIPESANSVKGCFLNYFWTFCGRYTLKIYCSLKCRMVAAVCPTCMSLREAKRRGNLLLHSVDNVDKFHRSYREIATSALWASSQWHPFRFCVSFTLQFIIQPFISEIIFRKYIDFRGNYDIVILVILWRKILYRNGGG